MTGAAAMKSAALLQALGMDGMRYLTTHDQVEATAMQLVARHAARHLEQRDKALAQLIGNAVARCFRG
jgi:hypothetical protein